MTKFVLSTILFTVAILLSAAPAQTLTGTVTNGTTNRPAAGDEVILINLTSGMEIAATTKADSAGKFSFTLKDQANGQANDKNKTAQSPAGPHLIRAVHQGVTYHQIVPTGTNSVEVNVYDVAPKVSDLSITADVVRFQADSGTMQGVRLFVVHNASSPAKTQLNDHNLEFYLPPGAKIDQVQARAPNGQPIATEAVPQAEKNRYALNFPLRPGETQFQMEFTMPYAGEVKIDPKLIYGAQHFVVVVPKTMKFKAASPPAFDAMNEPGQGDTTVEVVRDAKPGQQLAFTLEGNGVITENPGETASNAAQRDQAASSDQGDPAGQGADQSSQVQTPQGQSPATGDNRPGGGLGRPIDAPDALQKYRWPILGAFAALLAFGGWMVTQRPPAAAISTGNSPSVGDYSVALRPAPLAPQPSASSFAAPAKSSMLLEALKEELFQLEVEKKQGKVSSDEYDKAKAALDQTLERALKRQG